MHCEVCDVELTDDEVEAGEPTGYYICEGCTEAKHELEEEKLLWPRH